MEDVSKLKVGVLRDRLAALGEDSSWYRQFAGLLGEG